jgi:hypothetical protein
MTPVYQTKLPPAHPVGNCLAAVVASLLDLTIEEVPNFEVLGDEEGLWKLVLGAFFKQHGYFIEPYAPLYWHYVRDKTFPAGVENVPYICYGEVAGVPHVAIYANQKLVHDPTPKSGGLDKITDVWVLRHRIDPRENGGLGSAGLLTLPEIAYSPVPQVPDY